MSNKPIFVATHPRACSTAFERVFMTQRDTLTCFHEPFGDAYYFGPERMGARYENDEKTRVESGFDNTTFKSVFENIMRDDTDKKRVFIKDMAYYIMPPSEKRVSIAPSFTISRNEIEREQPSANASSKSLYPFSTQAEPGNPTIVPADLLKQFHFAFLIRHPKRSIPSYFRCTVPPLVEVTGWHNFMPEEAGYAELRRLFNYLRENRQIGPNIAGQSSKDASNGLSNSAEILIVDADDLLDHPAEVVEAFCKSVGIEYSDSLLIWDTEEDEKEARPKFKKWEGWHEDALNSKSLKPRTHKKADKSVDELYGEWVEKFGEEGAKSIKQTVEDNVADYEYLKQFAVRV